MIRNENEYQEAVRRIQEEKERLAEHRKRLEEMGLSNDEVKLALDPLRSFHEQLIEEVDSYERLKRGEMNELMNLHGLGHMLVGLRIALGLTQRELAERLGIHESQVSRDERNEYHGMTVERATRVLDALGVRLISAFDQPIISKPRKESATIIEPTP
jgi:DNA-directed RNA polymerase specialized sigma subunit